MQKKKIGNVLAWSVVKVCTTGSRKGQPFLMELFYRGPAEVLTSKLVSGQKR